MHCSIADKKFYIYTPKKNLYAVLDFDFLTCYVILNQFNPDHEFIISILGSRKQFKLRALSMVELDIWMKTLH